MSDMYSDDQSLERVFQEYLNNERILWAGQPDTSVHFTLMDIFLIPFSLMWGGFAIFWETSAIMDSAPLLFPLFGIPFVIVGLYMIFGRFIYKVWNKKRTYYAVTNKRVISVNTAFGQHFKDLSIKSIPGISKKVGSSGTGTITFSGTGNSIFSSVANWYLNTGMDFFAGSSDLGFLDIRDANEVYKIIMDVKSRFDS